MITSRKGGWRISRPAAFAVLLLSLMVGVSATQATAAGAATRYVAPDPCPAGTTGRLSCQPIGGLESPFEASTRDLQSAAPYVAGSGGSPDGAYAQALAERNRMLAATGGVGGTWLSAGLPPLHADGPYDRVSPTGQTIGSLGFRKVSGRLTDYAFDPVSRTLFAGETEGGVWALDRGATRWRSIGDNLPTQAVGALAWTPAGGGMLLVGSGDNGQGRYSYAGHGVYTTRDMGKTWVQADPTYQVIPDNTASFRIAVDPSAPLVYLASSRGLFRGKVSNSGAVAFTNVNLPTGVNNGIDCAGNVTKTPECYLANTVTDVVVRSADEAPQPLAQSRQQPNFTPVGGSVVATVGYRFGSSFYPKPDGTGVTATKYVVKAGIYRSPDGTVGSFDYVPPTTTGQCVVVNPNCFPGSDHVGRVALAGLHGPGQNRNVLYAIVQDPQKENHCVDDTVVPVNICSAGAGTGPGGNLSTALDGMYVSSDFGKTWTKNMDWKQLNLPGTNSSIGSLTGQAPLGYGPGIQAAYNLWVLPDPATHDSGGYPTRMLFGLEEIWENNPAWPGLNPTSTYWAEQKPDVPIPPWKVVGRYWAGCGPFTFGQGFQCNSPTESPATGSTTHPDQHAAIFVPDTPGAAGGAGETFYAGSDGGAFAQHVAPGAGPDQNKWGNGLNDGISALQCYDAEMAKDGTIVCGMQDNGEMKMDPATGLQYQVFGGDGFWSAIDPNNSKRFVEEYVGGVVSFTTDGGINWNRKDPALTSARFSTPFEADPRDPGHLIIGGRDIQENTHFYDPDQCAPSSAQPNSTCVLISTYNQWTKVYDLGTGKQPGVAGATASKGDTNNSTTATDLRGESAYVGFCSSCDVMLEGVPFRNGIATNVGGGALPKPGTSSGWHIAKALCDNALGTCPGGVLPHRYITSIRMDPSDANTVYVTLGGYQRAWIPPGTFGEANPNIGGGHLFKSTDHGDHFKDISANLPNVVAWHSVIHDGHLVVSTDIGVYQSTDTNGGAFTILGGNLPAAPVKTIRIAPGNKDLLLAATWGRGPYLYCFTGPSCPTNLGVTVANPSPIPSPPGVTFMPKTTASALVPLWPLVPALLILGLGAGLMRRRSRRA